MALQKLSVNLMCQSNKNNKKSGDGFVIDKQNPSSYNKKKLILRQEEQEKRATKEPTI